MRLSKTTLLLALALAAPTQAAMANDLIDAPEITTASIRADSGWYARVDAAHSLSNEEKGARVLRPSGAAGGGTLSESTGFSGGVGLGYRFNDIVRTDVTVRYGRYDVDGTADFAAVCGAGCRLETGGRRDVLDLGLNLYADLGTIVGITPYVGAGIGSSHVSYDGAAASLCTGAGCLAALDVSGQDGWRANYALMAGAAYALSETILVDAGYRYTHTVDGDALDARFADGNLLVQDKGADRHLLTVGLRFRLP